MSCKICGKSGYSSEASGPQVDSHDKRAEFLQSEFEVLESMKYESE